MGSIVLHIYDMERLYGSYENYLAETKVVKEQRLFNGDSSNVENNEDLQISAMTHDFQINPMSISQNGLPL